MTATLSRVEGCSRIDIRGKSSKVLFAPSTPSGTATAGPNVFARVVADEPLGSESRDSSPERLTRGAALTEVGVDAQASHPPSGFGAELRLTDSVLQQVPSVAVETGKKGLWLDRHHTLARMLDAPVGLSAAEKEATHVAAQSALVYTPGWDISSSAVWALAEQYVLGSAPPPKAQAPLQVPVPLGIGSGMASGVKRFRKAAFTIIAKGRIGMIRNLRDAADGALRPADPDCPGGYDKDGCCIVEKITDAVAEAVPTAKACPAAKATVKARVRAVIAGVSVAYAAANLAGCACALTHLDFSGDFANSAKAVLDFMTTAPCVHTMVGDLMHIGVAVGLGMANRDTPDV